MKTRRFRPAPRKTQRRWRVPPALTHGDDVFEGLSVLDEVPGETGLVLWQSLRDAMLWAGTPPDARAGLFAEGAQAARMAAVLSTAVPSALEPALSMLARMVGEPDTMTEEAVALSCREVSQWLDEQGLLASSLAFAQAAAVVALGDAATAFTVGRLARRRAEYARAETWFRRAVALARQAGDWGSYVRSFMGLAALYSQRGNYPVARRFLERSLKAANRNHLHELEAVSYHDLFALAVDAGRPVDAERYARRAFETYGKHHARLPILAQDVAYFWTTQGHFARAVPVLQTVVPHIQDTKVRLMALAGLARAAGGAGRSDVFQSAWENAHEILRDTVVEDHVAAIYLDLAQGAVSLRLWDRAEQAGARALEIATRRNEGRIRLTAESVLDSARHHRAVETRPAGTPSDADTAADELGANLVDSLRLAHA
jgi:tetratricopeptide (TPR) repeat protein